MSVMPSFGVALTVTIVMRKTALTSIVPCKKETRKKAKKRDFWRMGERGFPDMKWATKKKQLVRRRFAVYGIISSSTVDDETFLNQRFAVAHFVSKNSLSPTPLGNHNASELKEVFQPLETKRKKEKKEKGEGVGAIQKEQGTMKREAFFMHHGKEDIERQLVGRPHQNLKGKVWSNVPPKLLWDEFRMVLGGQPTPCFFLQQNRQLAKLLSGFVTGQITVAKVVVTVAAQSLARSRGKWPAAARELSLSFRSAAVCLVVFGSLLSFSSLLWYRLETTGLIWANESAIKEHLVSVFSLSDVGDIRVCARLHREPCQASNRFALFHVLPTLSFLHIFLFPVTSEIASRSLNRGWWCSAVSRATLFCRRRVFTDGNRPVPSLADVDPTALLWAPEASQAQVAMDVVERKEAVQEKTENDARKDWVAMWKKTWRLEQTKEGRCLSLARWCVGMNVDIVNVQSLFPHFQSCWALLLFSKQCGSRWKR